jgi:hypothetical protein
MVKKQLTAQAPHEQHPAKPAGRLADPPLS